MEQYYEYPIEKTIFYQEQMIQKHCPEYLVPHQILGDRYVYDLQDYTPFLRVIRENADSNLIYKLLQTIQKIELKLEDLFLDECRMIREPEYWFYNEQKEQWAGIYIPDESYKDESEGIEERILKKMLYTVIDQCLVREEEIQTLYRMLLEIHRTGILSPVIREPSEDEFELADPYPGNLIVLSQTEYKNLTFWEKLKKWLSLRF